MKGVFMPFGKALLRFFLEKGVITPFHLALLCLSKRYYYAFLKVVITPFLCTEGVIKPFHVAL